MNALKTIARLVAAALWSLTTLLACGTVLPTVDDGEE